MQEYNFLRNISAGWLDIYSRYRIVPVGKYAELMLCDKPIVDMRWDDLHTFVNINGLTFAYPKRFWPNHKWPWPFRNITQPTVVIEGVELYTGSELRFRFELEGFSKYLRPGDTCMFEPGSIKITI